MPALAIQAVAPINLLDVTSCSCSTLKACSKGNCSCHAASISCTDYCKCEGDFGDMSEDAAKGFESDLMRRSCELENSCQQAVSTYSAIVDDFEIEDTERRVDSEGENGFSSPESEEED
ncbi:unnamed protein product [Arctogadus glacialis]